MAIGARERGGLICTCKYDCTNLPLHEPIFKKLGLSSKIISEPVNLRASGDQTVRSRSFNNKRGMAALVVINFKAAEGKFDALGDFFRAVLGDIRAFCGLHQSRRVCR